MVMNIEYPYSPVVVENAATDVETIAVAEHGRDIDASALPLSALLTTSICGRRRSGLGAAALPLSRGALKIRQPAEEKRVAKKLLQCGDDGNLQKT